VVDPYFPTYHSAIMPTTTSSRRVALLLILLFAFICVLYIAPINSDSIKTKALSPITQSGTAHNAQVEEAATTGHVIMPKLGNETAKYEVSAL